MRELYIFFLLLRVAMKNHTSIFTVIKSMNAAILFAYEHSYMREEIYGDCFEDALTAPSVFTVLDKILPTGKV